MGSIGNPKAWVPYVNSKDCSQGFCSLYCPQWCYIIFPPPPPFEFSDDNSSPSFSPLVIAIIGILASAFLLVSYYSIISKYCGNTNSSRRRENDDPIDEDLARDNSSNPSLHEQPWHVAAATGLDEALIKSITVCKYRSGDGLIEGTDCSVCLSEFEEDESVRLLPKCNHAFHVQCIDTWLKSHSNCPLCRANIFFISASPPQLPPTMAETETPPNHGSLQDHSQGGSENIDAAQDHREGDDGEDHEIVHNNGMIPKSPVRALSDLGNLQGRDIVIEIRDGGHDQDLRRSVSMDHLCQSSRVSIAQVLQMNQDDDMIEDGESVAAGSSKQYPSAAEFVKCSRHKRKMVHCVTNHVAMKRSISSGRQGRVREAIVPL